MANTFADEVYSSLMEMWHEWTCDEIYELMDLLDEMAEKLSTEEEANWPEEVFLPDEWDYGIIAKENCLAFMD